MPSILSTGRGGEGRESRSNTKCPSSAKSVIRIRTSAFVGGPKFTFLLAAIPMHAVQSSARMSAKYGLAICFRATRDSPRARLRNAKTYHYACLARYSGLYGIGLMQLPKLLLPKKAISEAVIKLHRALMWWKFKKNLFCIFV